MKDSAIKVNGINNFGPLHNGKILIAGPCAAESPDQLLRTAQLIKKHTPEVSIFRAGVWKPRTRPGQYQGAGEKALEWLKEVKLQTGLLTCTEVANPQQAEKAIEAGIDIIWIGARTTVNPFYVQDIADAVRGCKIPVMVKNPLHPDVSLWMGALERFNRSGIEDLVGIHRGFYTTAKTRFRNEPNWSMVMELMVQCPGLPVICDPSHICGNRHLIPAISQKAMDLNLAGLMVETHFDPDNALSDAKQQLTPFDLFELINGLTIRDAAFTNFEFETKLEELRAKIDRIDLELLKNLSRRMEVVEQIGEFKLENNVTILQLERWLEILNTRTSSGKILGLDETFVKKLLQLLHKEAIRVQEQVMNEKMIERKTNI